MPTADHQKYGKGAQLVLWKENLLWKGAKRFNAARDWETPPCPRYHQGSAPVHLALSSARI